MKKIEKKIIYLFSLTTNFKPGSLKNFDNVNSITHKDANSKNKKISCRNFFLFLILIKFNKKDSFKKSSFFIKPLRKNLQTILRAPYRHKISRHQLTLIRYKAIFKIVFKPNNTVEVSKYKDVMKVFRKLSLYNKWLESNLISNYKIRFSFDFSYKNNFIIINFTKNKKSSQWLCLTNTI